MIYRGATYFIDSEMIRNFQKMCGYNSESTETKNYLKNYARYTTLKNYFLWLTFGRMTIMRISK